MTATFGYSFQNESVHGPWPKIAALLG